MTSGARWSNRQPVLNGVTVLQIDCRHFHDPDNDRNLRGHVGRHPGIMRGLARNHAMEEFVEQVKACWLSTCIARVAEAEVLGSQFSCITSLSPRSAGALS